MKDEIADNLRDVYGRIIEACDKYDRDADDITLVGITKRHSTATIRTAVASGIYNIGESRVQEAELKISEVGQIARFHMVGHLQTNKVKKAVSIFDVIQSVDSLKLAKEIDREAGKLDFKIECLIEVNCSGESRKEGINPEAALELIEQVNALPNIDLTGLMTIAPNTDDVDNIRASFRKCHELFKQGRDIAGNQFDTLSMGMSGDFEHAIAEGSTMIRVGTALFGPRD